MTAVSQYDLRIEHKTREVKERYKTKQQKDFYQAIRKVIEYLNDKHHPHTKIIIVGDWYEILEWIESKIIIDYIKD